MKLLTIAAHPDDELLGCGGTINRYVKQGYKAYCLILAEGMTSRNSYDDDAVNLLHNDSKIAADIIGYEEVIFADFPDNRLDSVDVLDVVKVIENTIELLQPEIVFTHHFGDLNIDHKVAFEATQVATRTLTSQCVKKVVMYETFSATEWNFTHAFKPNMFVDIGDGINIKKSAMAAYKSELRDYPHPRSLKALEIAAQRWGTVAGMQYAEAFEILRAVYNDDLF